MKSPHFVDWAITRKCNLSCLHCRGMTEEELSNEEVKRVIEEIAELKPGWVIVEGGEPLLREGIFEVLENIKDKGLKVYLITNGTILDLEKIKTLKQLGIKVMISIDSANPTSFEKMRRGASFHEVVQAARDCAKEGLLDAINSVVSRANYKELPRILELAKSIGAGKVIILGLKPCKGYSEQVLSFQEYEEAIKLACEASMETESELFFDEPFFWPVVKEWKLSVKSGTESGILSLKTNACIMGEYIFIEPNGEVKPCTFSPLISGNVRRRGLVRIWQDMSSSDFLTRLQIPTTRKGYCRSCQYLAECKGCRSRTFALTGDWFASDPSCPLRVRDESDRH